MKSNKIFFTICAIFIIQIPTFAQTSTDQNSAAADVNSPSTQDSKSISEIDSLLNQKSNPEPELTKDIISRPLTTKDQKKLNVSDYSKLISRKSFADYNVIQKNQMIKSSKVELKSGISKIINDGFYANFGLHLDAIYNFNESWGVGLGGVLLGSGRTSQTKNIQEIQLTPVDSVMSLKNTYNASVYFTPIYGKWALLNTTVLPFEIYFSLGTAQVTDQNNKSFQAVSGSLGQLISLSDTTGLDIQIQGLSYQAKNINNEDQPMSSLLLSVSYSIFLPTAE